MEYESWQLTTLIDHGCNKGQVLCQHVVDGWNGIMAVDNYVVSLYLQGYA